MFADFDVEPPPVAPASLADHQGGTDRHDVQFELPWFVEINENLAIPTTIAGNCSWLRNLTTDVYALKSHALRDYTPGGATVRHAFRTCFAVHR